MIKDERGFSTPLALAVIVSLCTIVLAYSMLVGATERKICSYQSFVSDRKEVEEILKDVSIKMQLLRDEVNDTEYSFVVENIESEFSEFNLHLEDVSSAVNTNFLKKEILESEPFALYLNNLNCKLSDYGWINPKYADKELIENIKNDYSGDDEIVFIKTYPFYNLFRMDPDLLLTILNYNKIKEPEEAISKISKLNENDINKKELSKIFGVSESSPLFDFIGTKTVFWKTTFETDTYLVEAVYALIPDNFNKNNVKEYKLVERRISHKGGGLC